METKLLEKKRDDTKPRYVRLSADDFAFLHNYAVVRGDSFASYAGFILRREIARIKRELENQHDTEDK